MADELTSITFVKEGYSIVVKVMMVAVIAVSTTGGRGVAVQGTVRVDGNRVFSLSVGMAAVQVVSALVALRVEVILDFHAANGKRCFLTCLLKATRGRTTQVRSRRAFGILDDSVVVLRQTTMPIILRGRACSRTVVEGDVSRTGTLPVRVGVFQVDVAKTVVTIISTTDKGPGNDRGPIYFF